MTVPAPIRRSLVLVAVLGAAALAPVAALRAVDAHRRPRAVRTAEETAQDQIVLSGP